MTDLQIESFTVRRYRCPFCPRTASRPGRIREHAERCWYNPAARGCKTCKHYSPGSRQTYGEPGEEEACLVGESLEGHPACQACGGYGQVDMLPGYIAECTDCPGAEVKPGPVVGCHEWERG